MTCEITARNVAYSVGDDAPPLLTQELRYPRIIHSEFLTHRVFSRNARSSRAVPVARLLDEVRERPFVPRYWGANQKGMQADAECDAQLDLRGSYGSEWCTRESAWLRARDFAAEHARAFHAAGYHKQVVNRLLEPFMHIDTLVTATEWANWDALRDDKAAEPHIRDLAQAMKEARQSADPVLLKPGQWHLPYVDGELLTRANDPTAHNQDRQIALDIARKVSATRCARISYAPFHGESGDIAAEVQRAEDLIASRPMHASPLEHQATPDGSRRVGYPDDYYVVWSNERQHANLTGWRMYRKMLPGEVSHGR